MSTSDLNPWKASYAYTLFVYPRFGISRMNNIKTVMHSDITRGRDARAIVGHDTRHPPTKLDKRVILCMRPDTSILQNRLTRPRNTTTLYGLSVWHFRDGPLWAYKASVIVFLSYKLVGFRWRQIGSMLVQHRNKSDQTVLYLRRLLSI